MIKTLSITFMLSVIIEGSAFSQGTTALPFLLVSPSAVSRGMGETSVAIFRDDPFAVIDNPAHLGIFSQSNYVSAGYDYSDWLPQFQQSDLTYKVFGVNAGLNLQKEFGIGPNVSVGLGYSRIRLDLGEFAETSPDGPEVISTFDAYETADHYSIGVGLDFWIRLAGGYTYKRVNSVLPAFNVQGQDRTGTAELSTYDVGVFLAAPVMEIIGRAAGSPVTVMSGIRPILDLNVGLSKNNMSDAMVVYVDPGQPDPQPRFAREGIAIEAGVSYGKEGTDWRPVFMSWTRESNDLLVERFPAPTDSNGNVIGDPPPPRYREGFGDIRFLDDLILGKSNPNATIKTGWQVDLGEFVTIRGGRYSVPTGDSHVTLTTSGYTLRLAGVFKILTLLDVRAEQGSVLETVMNHVDLRYSRGSVSSDDASVSVPNPEFNSWMVKYSL